MKVRRSELEKRVDDLEQEVERLRNRVEPTCHCGHGRKAHTNPFLGPRNPPSHCYVACGCHAYSPPVAAKETDPK